MRTKVVIALVFTALLLSLAIVPAAMASDPEPGTVPAASSFATSASSSLAPVVTETGKITLSLDAAGNNSASSTIQVEKPSAAATVRSAYMMSATIYGGGHISDGDVTIDGNAISWNVETTNVLSGSYNYWTDATALVKAKIDAAPAGLVDFTLVEVNRNSYIDGEILAVIFDDPAQAASNTVILCFGSQNHDGDTFAIGLAEPIDKSDPNLVLDFSLGISYSYQIGSQQYSIVDVNSQRLSTSAGGEDDGASYNGGLITVGGVGDSNANPADPNATPDYDFRYDDELYTLLPYVDDGDTSITVETENPSNDDNMMFAALFLGGTTAVVGEGIVLTPTEAVNPVGSNHTLTAKVLDETGAPVPGVTVAFSVIAGPNVGLTGYAVTDSNGEAEWTYSSSVEGTDTIQACTGFVYTVDCLPPQQTEQICSNEVTKTWQKDVPPVPELSTIVLFGIGLLMLGGLVVLVRRKPSAV